MTNDESDESGDVHVYPEREEDMHVLRAGECPCHPERKTYPGKVGIVWVHRRLRA